ncbi:MAG: hypothetical protein IT363_06825 [Methanoregulaceae archaeon]|nr:hypothetical protein [Methanoregulaceae archaeon]
MSRSNNDPAGYRSGRKARVIGWVGGIAIGLVAMTAVVPILGKDAFAGYREPQGVLGGETGVRMEDVGFRSYQKGELVAQADLDRVDVRRDRQFFDIQGVHNGFVISKEGRIDFDAPSATYDQIVQSLRFGAGVKVKSDDFDLFAPKLNLSQLHKNLQAPGPVTGQLKGGTVSAMNLKYTMDKREFVGGPIKWQGVLPKEIQDTPIAQDKKPWNIEGGGVKTNQTTLTWTNGRATDGEIIVKAPRIEQDRRTEVLTCTGPVYYFSKKVNLVADKAVIYRKEKRAVLSGNVRMLVKPKSAADLTEQEIPPFRPDVPAAIAQNRPAAPQSAEDQQQKDLDEALRSSKSVRDYPSMIKAVEIDYVYAEGRRRGVITGSPEAYQEFADGKRWRRIQAFRGIYDGEVETLRLESTPQKVDVLLKNSIGDDLIGDWFLVSTKEDDEEWEGEKVKGVVMADEDELPKDKKTPPPTGSGGG